MLVLTRRVGEGIMIAEGIKIVVMQIKGKQVRLGIKANPTIAVYREELGGFIPKHSDKPVAKETT
jgi:carbon storage regulator